MCFGKKCDSAKRLLIWYLIMSYEKCEQPLWSSSGFVVKIGAPAVLCSLIIIYFFTRLKMTVSYDDDSALCSYVAKLWWLSYNTSCSKGSIPSAVCHPLTVRSNASGDLWSDPVKLAAVRGAESWSKPNLPTEFSNSRRCVLNPENLTSTFLK